ncbi:hypothetical protein ACP4OV_008010 [Aristida adscensionis]
MASKKPADLESQVQAPPPASASGSAAAAASRPATVPGGATNGHGATETEPLLVRSDGGDEEEEGGGGAAAGDDETTRLERAMARAFRSTADLAKHLPTGAVLVFEVLSPVFTNGGACDDVNRAMASWLVGLCAAACFLLCFTDSFTDGKGTVRYVVATRAGLWVIDGTPPPPPEDAARYRLKFIDFFHAVLSLVVFMSVAMFDRNVGACFNPVMSYDTRQILTAVPLAGGLVGTLLFATFPSTRRGIGFPVPPV